MNAPTLDWFSDAPTLLLGALLLCFTLAVGYAGHLLRMHTDRDRAAEPQASEGQEGYIVSGMLGLLALLMGFTFAISVDRFDTRRRLVLHEANAINTMYFRTQLLGEPHRARLSNLLVAYTDNRVALGSVDDDEARARLLSINDRLLADIGAASAAAFDSVSNIDFSSSFVESVKDVMNLDAARKASRLAHVPMPVFVVLLIYIVVTAGVLGYVLVGFRILLSGGLFVALLMLSLLLIIDLDRPTTGVIRESQGPMERLRALLKAEPPENFDRWRQTPQP